MMHFQRTLLCSVAFCIFTSLAIGQRADTPTKAIKVEVRLDRNKFRLGEQIIFRVIISNVGWQPFLVPNEMKFFTRSHGSLDFEVKNQSGKIVAPTAGWAEDCFDYKPTKLLYENIFSDYLLLPPGTSYIQQTSLGDLYNQLKPGTYHVKSSYSASFSPIGCQKWTAEDVAKFPFQSWQGTTSVNDISFTILPNSKK